MYEERHEFEFGSATVTYSEVDGLLVTRATAISDENYSHWSACRSFEGIAVAVRAAIMGDPGGDTNSYVGYSYQSEYAAIQDFRRNENEERMRRNEDEGLCHCGHPLFGSDHCPLCGCEEYESYCDTNYHDSANGRVTCDCPHHDSITSVEDDRAFQPHLGWR